MSNGREFARLCRQLLARWSLKMSYHWWMKPQRFWLENYGWLPQKQASILTYIYTKYGETPLRPGAKKDRRLFSKANNLAAFSRFLILKLVNVTVSGYLTFINIDFDDLSFPFSFDWEDIFEYQTIKTVFDTFSNTSKIVKTLRTFNRLWV